jgi:beta-lactamase class A
MPESDYADPSLAALGRALLDCLLDAQRTHELTEQDVAISWSVHERPLRPGGAGTAAAQFGWREAAAFYPCSVVKLFWLLACQARLHAGEIAAHEELDRAMADMIRWSSNTATNYVVDLVSGTTGDTLLAGPEYDVWAARRGWANRFLRGLGWAEIDAGVNVCQKAMDDDRYGRERQFIGSARDNHNRLTTRAVRRLITDVMAGTVLSAERCGAMAALMRRPTDQDWAAAHPHGQVSGYFGAGLPAGSRLWSKAGWTTWTGDEAASYRRHDAAYVEAPGCPPFVLVVLTRGRASSADETMLPGIASHACALLRRL